MSKITDIFNELWVKINQHEKLFNSIIVPIIVGLIIVAIPIYFSNLKKYFGKVEITNESFVNVPKYVNGEELLSNDTDILENYVQAKLIIENSNFESTIHKLNFMDVTIKLYQYVDIVIQNGFDNNTQIVDFYRLNNGTQQSHKSKYYVDIKYHNSINSSTSIIDSRIIDGKALMSGDIESIFNINLSNSNIKKYFNNTIPDYKQDIEISIHSNHEKSKIIIPYLSSEGRFVRNLGGSGIPLDKPIVPVLELNEPYKQNYSFTIVQRLMEGKNYLKFNILVDEASLITYKINLINDKGQTIASTRQKDPIKIRFPKYKLLSTYEDEIYYYMKNNKLNESNFKEVKLRQPALVNSIDKTKKEYNLQK